jgi:hypothetical protein
MQRHLRLTVQVFGSTAKILPIVIAHDVPTTLANSLLTALLPATKTRLSHMQSTGKAHLLDDVVVAGNKQGFLLALELDIKNATIQNTLHMPLRADFRDMMESGAEPLALHCLTDMAWLNSFVRLLALMEIADVQVGSLRKKGAFFSVPVGRPNRQRLKPLKADDSGLRPAGECNRATATHRCFLRPQATAVTVPSHLTPPHPPLLSNPDPD